VEKVLLTLSLCLIVNNILNNIVTLVLLFVKSKNWNAGKKYNGVSPGDTGISFLSVLLQELFTRPGKQA
jgi:hypothetical protein